MYLQVFRVVKCCEDGFEKNSAKLQIVNLRHFKGHVHSGTVAAGSFPTVGLMDPH